MPSATQANHWVSACTGVTAPWRTLEDDSIRTALNLDTGRTGFRTFVQNMRGLRDTLGDNPGTRAIITSSVAKYVRRCERTVVESAAFPPGDTEIYDDSDE
jgi:hypothetical protein